MPDPQRERPHVSSWPNIGEPDWAAIRPLLSLPNNSLSFASLGHSTYTPRISALVTPFVLLSFFVRSFTFSLATNIHQSTSRVLRRYLGSDKLPPSLSLPSRVSSLLDARRHECSTLNRWGKLKLSKSFAFPMGEYSFYTVSQRT